MKRLFSIVLCLSLLLSMTCIVASAANTGSLSSSGTARAGETFTVTFTARGTVGAYSGTLSYDGSQVTLVSATNAGGSHWSSFSQSGNNIYAQRDSGTTDVVSFNATFKVNSGVATGTSIKIGFSGSIASSSSSEDSFSTSVTKTVEAPLSNDATLASLTVSNATLTPAFNANTTSYSCGTVKFDVAKLGVTATANGQGATVSVSGANLGVGKNTINVVVTAASGAKKTYTITVEREQDPNYVASNDTKLADIEVSTGALSPEFNVDTREYVVYVPFETTKITISGTAANELAKGVENIEDANLEVGINELALKVTAEDDTVGEYKIYVVRMDQFGGYETLGLPASLSGVQPTEPGDDTPVVVPTTSGIALPYWMIAVIVVAALLIGFLIGMLVFKKRKNDDEPDDYDDPDDYLEETDYENDDSAKVIQIDDYEDIDTGRDDAEAEVENEADINDYLPVEEEPVESPTSTVTFADLTEKSVEMVEPEQDVEPSPKVEERPHVHYIAYEEYIDSLGDDN